MALVRAFRSSRSIAATPARKLRKAMGASKLMMRVPARAVLRVSCLPIIVTAVALALSGCMQTASPVATARSSGDLDSMAYGPPAVAQPARVAEANGGAISALRNATAGAPATYVDAAPVQARYDSRAAAPTPVRWDGGYRLDAGDKLRVVVYGQEGLTNTYAIDAGGSITMPLIGQVPARGRSPAALAAEISAKLRNGYIREPSVAVEIEAYRPFFILGEVQAPGQYPYVPNMTVESAVAIAGGFSPRAKRDAVTLTHTDGGGAARAVVPLGTSLSPGDTVYVGERWF
jgi:polysaccharide biosynthesis/export protein